MQLQVTQSALLMSALMSQTYCAQSPKLSGEELKTYEQRYKEAIYTKQELEHYLSKINTYFLVEPLKEPFINFSTLNKIYNDNLPLAADLTAYYQNQFVRTELYWASRKEGTRSQKYRPDQIEEMVQQINAKIDQLVSKHVDSIAAFEKANQPKVVNEGGSPAISGPDRPLGNDTSTWKVKVQEPKDLSMMDSKMESKSKEEVLVGNKYNRRTWGSGK